VTSDHGEGLGEHGEKTHTLGIYDATQRVPLLLVGPGLPAGRVVHEPVRLIDLGPTLLARAGAAPLPGARGRDLSELAAGRAPAPPPAYLETLETQLAMGWSPLLGVRTAGEKYIRAPRPELYDLAADPHELVNLAAERPERVRELDAELARLAEGARAADAAPELDAAERQKLVALGYLSAAAPAAVESLGVVGGPNPRDHVHEVGAMLYASELVSQGRGHLALAALEPVQVRGPYFHQLRALAALQAQQAALALESAEAVLAAGLRSEGLRLRGLAELARHDPAAARRDLEAAHALDPLDVQAVLGLGLVAEAEGELDAAAERYQEAARLGEDAPGARFHLALLRVRQGQLEEADALVSGLRPHLREDPTMMLRLAAAERAAGRSGRADRWLDEGLAADPRSAPLLEARAEALETAGEFGRALELRRRLHALAPGDPDRQNGLAWAMALAGQELDAALSLAQRAVAGSSHSHAALDTLATVHLARGEAQAALEAAERGLDGAAAPLRPHLLYLRAAALAELGRGAEARAALRALEGEPEALGAPWDARAAELQTRLTRLR
jgi:Flp pilus assembly protein TadD